MRLRYKFATQKVGACFVAVAIEEDALKYSEILRMNSAGAFILEQLKDEIDYAVLTERMLDKYDTNQETAQKILMDFLSMLAEKELLVDAKGNLIKESALREAVYFF